MPMKPSMVAPEPSISFRSAEMVSRMNGRLASGSSIGFRAATSARVRTGLEMIGPLPLTTSNSTPSAGSGVRMSLNMMTPSGWNARNGWRESSIAISEVSLLCLNPYLSLYARNSAMYRPAWRISQTGGRSVCSPRAARRRMGSSGDEPPARTTTAGRRRAEAEDEGRRRAASAPRRAAPCVSESAGISKGVGGEGGGGAGEPSAPRGVCRR